MEQLAELSRMEQGLLRKLAALEERAEVRADDGLGQIHANATRLRTALPGERLAARAEPARAEPHEKGASIVAYEGAETRDMVEELKKCEDFSAKNERENAHVTEIFASYGNVERLRWSERGLRINLHLII